MLVRFRSPQLGVRLGFIQDDTLYDLTATGMPEWSGLAALLKSEKPLQSIRAGAERYRDHAVSSCSGKALVEKGVDGDVTLLPPIDSQEVWAAGVTYKRSEEARKSESEGAALFYGLVYEAERPELFFKATPHRTVGHTQAVTIREDAGWNVPEPELGVVLSRDLDVVGFVVGNDMSSRDIEGENPLYLPQAKVWVGSCAVGPGIALADEIPDPYGMKMELRIVRDGDAVFDDDIALTQMHRTIDDLVQYLGRANVFPDGVILLTGTGLVPENDFTLAPGDRIRITIDQVGTLENTVEVFGAKGLAI